MMETRFVYQNLSEEQRDGVIRLWITSGVLSVEEAHKRVAQVSVLIFAEDKIVGVSTVYSGMLTKEEKPWFFFRMFIQEENRGSNKLRTEVMQLNFTELKRRYATEFQGVVLELENTKLAKLAETTDYVSKRGYTFFGNSGRGLGLWYVRFDKPAGIFAQSDSLRVLKILGIPDDNNAKVLYNDGFFNNFTLFFDGNSSFLENRVIAGCQIDTLYVGGEKYPKEFSLKDRPEIIVNMICDPESHKNSLALCEKLSSIAPIINRPDLIYKTARDHVSTHLPSTDLFIIPKTVRISPHNRVDIMAWANDVFEGKSFLFRPVSSHGGKGLIRVEEYSSELFEGYVLDGKTDYFITEYIDYHNEDGLYRKMRFFIIDGVPYPRHKIASESWMIHSQSRSHLMSQTRFQEEEKIFLKNPPAILEAFCRHTYDYLQLDYFGIDCALLEDGKVVLFEANVCMRPFTHHTMSYLDEAIMNIKNGFTALLQQGKRR